jgi:C_GCAxxG_C_C family probable redox protein
MTHKEKALKLLKQEYNCAQAIVGAYAGDYGFNEKNAMKMVSCFGEGMHHGGLCGCVTAALVVCGMAYGIYNPQDKELLTYSDKMAEVFYYRFAKKMRGKVLCRDILGVDISSTSGLAVAHNGGLVKKVCPEVLSLAIDLLDELLLENTIDEAYVIPDKENDAEILVHRNELHKFRADVQELIASSDNEIVFIQFDIKRFKIINDLYGEKFGDEVLHFMRQQLKTLCGSDKYFLNVRSDVFMVVMKYDDKREVDDFIKKVEQELYSFKGVKIHLAFGLYFVEDRDIEVRQMEDMASMARKSIKTNVLTNVMVYQQSFKDTLYTRKFIEDNMQAAIQEKQFKMYLQPKYSISEHKIIGAEALVRWIHPERGVIFPNEFIPVIEENGFIKLVDYYIWDEAGAFIRKCADAGINDCPISVNVSRNHLANEGFITMLNDNIVRNGIDKHLLELEITETADGQYIGDMVDRLKKEGFKLLMDDFGSGYSSLNVLLETPFDVIKLDKKFIDNMMTSDKGRKILEYVVAMADSIGLDIIAEGVETAEQAQFLSGMGCDMAQGYYFAKPMKHEEFFELLKAQKQHEQGIDSHFATA